MASHNLADIKFTLSPEHWSPTSIEEDKILEQVASEDEKRRLAVQARKEAENARRKAEILKNDKERRWATRQEAQNKPPDM